MNIRTGRAVYVGIGGTIAMTAVGLWIPSLMGVSLVSGSMTTAGGSLIGHLVYGGVVGAIYSWAWSDAAPGG